MQPAIDSESSPLLPGLEDEHTSPTSSTALVEAVRRTFARLDAAGVLDERHAGMMALALYLADALGNATAMRRASSVALLSRELRETLSALPEPVEDAAADEWNSFEANFRAAALGDTPNP